MWGRGDGRLPPWLATARNLTPFTVLDLTHTSLTPDTLTVNTVHALHTEEVGMHPFPFRQRTQGTTSPTRHRRERPISPRSATAHQTPTHSRHTYTNGGHQDPKMSGIPPAHLLACSLTDTHPRESLSHTHITLHTHTHSQK